MLVVFRLQVVCLGKMDYAAGRDAEALAADLAVLRRITHIVDADGFAVQGVFYPREMTVLQLRDNLMVRYEFRLPCKKSQLSQRDYQSANFVRDNIHGMRFSDEHWQKSKERWQAMLPASINAPVACLLEMAKLSGSDRCLFAYKGGNCVRMWLERANLCSINLEVLGCPRFDDLITPRAENNDYYQIRKNSCAVSHYHLGVATSKNEAVPCDMHIRWYGRYPPHRPIHCPASECRIFALWREKRMAALANNLV